MCGRFFWDNDAEEAFEDDFPELIRIARAQEKSLRAGDYMPSMDALAVVGGQEAVGGQAAGMLNGTRGAGEDDLSGMIEGNLREDHPTHSADPISAEILKWGFPGFDKGKLLINARAESVKTRPTFADSFASRRCVLPAAGFYEWDRKKEKVTFRLGDKPILYLAGIYRPYGAEKRFVVLTREANESMRPVHDRMPLILSKEEVRPWVGNMEEAGGILTKELPQLVAERPYEQMTFEW